MKVEAGQIEDKVEQLLLVLDEDVRHLQQCLSRLDELRSLVIKRDDLTLGRVLEKIWGQADSYITNESKRQSLRKELAAALGCGIEQMTLSRLEAELPGEKKAQVKQRKTKLQTLTGQLKKEHLKTALLLSECARFNNLLLKSIFETAETGTLLYDSNGKTSRQGDAPFVNMHF